MKISKKSISLSDPILFQESESATTAIISIILLMGIIFSVFAMVQLGHVPEWKNDIEYIQMGDIREDMAKLKSKIDVMTVVLAANPDSPKNEISTNVPFHMRKWEVPLIGAIKSSGSVSMNKDRCKMTVFMENQTACIIDCGTVTYRSNNRYYVNQVFKYENGALILAQKNQSAMKLYPAIRVTKNPHGNYSFSVNAVEIRGSRNTLSSNTGGSIRLEGHNFETLLDTNDYENVSSFGITIDSEYPGAWESYLNEMMTNAGLEKDTDYNLNIVGNDHVYISFPEEGSSYSLDRLLVSKTAVNAELYIG